MPNLTGHASLPLDQVIEGDCIQRLAELPANSIDLIFADPPYNLQLRGDLHRPDQSTVDAVDDDWDQFSSMAAYDAFTQAWLAACRRVLKAEGTIWVIGSYHNIFRVGAIMLDLGYWILNDVIWHKANPMPNFRGTRFTNATETLIWAQRSKDQKRYTFNYQAMKNLNEDKQMPNVWHLPLCTGAERLKVEGRKAHSTQKPEALLYRVVLASSSPGDVVLDPFFGIGTTGAAAKKLGRHYIGIEREPAYTALARQRLGGIPPAALASEVLITPSKRTQRRIAFAALLEAGYLSAGQLLYSQDRKHSAQIRADGILVAGALSGSIHQVAAQMLGQSAHNGWEFWYAEDDQGSLTSIDALREAYRAAQGTDAA